MCIVRQIKSEFPHISSSLTNRVRSTAAVFSGEVTSLNDDHMELQARVLT